LGLYGEVGGMGNRNTSNKDLTRAKKGHRKVNGGAEALCKIREREWFKTKRSNLQGLGRVTATGKESPRRVEKAYGHSTELPGRGGLN